MNGSIALSLFGRSIIERSAFDLPNPSYPPEMFNTQRLVTVMQDSEVRVICEAPQMAYQRFFWTEMLILREVPIEPMAVTGLPKMKPVAEAEL